MRIETVDQYYADRWSKMDTFRLYSSPAKSRRLSLIARYIEEFGAQLLLGNDVHVLDYGCGSGWLLPFLRFYGFERITAYDVTPQPLSLVAQKYPWVEVLQGNLEFPSPLPDASFNLVTSIEVLEHIPQNSHEKYFRDLYRVTRPGGIVIMTTPNALWRSHLLPEKEQPVEDWVSIREFRQLAQVSGFKILSLGSRGIKNYSSIGNWILLHSRVKQMLTTVRLWNFYNFVLENFGRGITVHSVLQRVN